MKIEFVSWCDLCGQTGARQLEAFPAARLLARIGEVFPFARIARVQVRKNPWNRTMLSFIAERAVVPQAILLDGPADAERFVPLLDQLPRRRQSLVLQFLRVVAAHPRLRHAGEINLSLHRVAAALRHDAERRAADFGFAETARRR